MKYSIILIGTHNTYTLNATNPGKMREKKNLTTKKKRKHSLELFLFPIPVMFLNHSEITQPLFIIVVHCALVRTVQYVTAIYHINIQHLWLYSHRFLALWLLFLFMLFGCSCSCVMCINFTSSICFFLSMELVSVHVLRDL